MREDLYWEQCVIMTRKNFILLELLDDFILRVFESGLIKYWQNEVPYCNIHRELNCLDVFR